MLRSVKFRSDERPILMGSIMDDITPMKRPDLSKGMKVGLNECNEKINNKHHTYASDFLPHLAPDQLKYREVIVPQDAKRTSDVAFAMNKIAIVVGKAMFENIICRTLAIDSLYPVRMDWRLTVFLDIVCSFSNVPSDGM